MALLFAVFLVGFVLGVLTIIAAEGFAILLVINRLNKKARESEAADLSAHRDVDHGQSLDSAFHKQGDVWVLETERVPKAWQEKAQHEQKKKKEFYEVSPVRKHAIIKNHSLVLTEADGSLTAIQLKGCIIEAVSATNLPSRKWAKRFPIKLENKNSAIYKGSKVLHIYLETSWEKESWCKALRFVSCDDKRKRSWFSELQKKFKHYLISLHEGYPSFIKPPAAVYVVPIDRENRIDGSSSKVRLFWKKLAKKVSKGGVENKSSWTSISSHEERKLNEKLLPQQDSASASASGSLRAAPPSHSSSLPHCGSQSSISLASDVDYDDKFGVDEGTLCWNLVISRLFFDAINNEEIRRSMKARIQRSLSNMRTPSYIGEVICTDIDTGNLPPHIHSMRVLPMDMSEVWAFEVDIEYCGGAVLDIETRIEVHELDLNKDISNSEEVSSDLLEGLEYFGKQLNLCEGKDGTLEQKSELDPKIEGLKSSKSSIPSTYKSRWKSILNSIAKQVSEVPISLRIKVASLRGTIRVYIKPPPSDQLWFGFTSMPEIDLNLESSVGDHKITSGRIALFLINRFKASIRETMVLPNCDSLGISWMLAEKDDWVQRKAAPFLWPNQEASKDVTGMMDKPSSQQVEAKLKTELKRQLSSDNSDRTFQKQSNTESDGKSTGEPADTSGATLNGSNLPKQSVASQELTTSGATLNGSNLPKQSVASQELTTPLLQNNDGQEDLRQNGEISLIESPSRSTSSSESQDITIEHDDARQKRTGRRARMLDLGKKMSEKIEEKRRHLEEKSRHIVERMRAP